MDNYQEEALRTKSNNFFADKFPATLTNIFMINRLGVGKALDAMKKAVFYGKPVPDGYVSLVEETKDLGSYSIPEDLLHGVIGLDTESAELLTHVFTEEMDPMKIIDECGDTLWYLNLILTSVGSSIPEAQRANIAKLKARYPDKFSNSQALSPDRTNESEAIRATIGN